MNLETRLPTALWEAVRMNYEKRNFTGSILDGFYFLSDLLRTKSGVEGDGATLIGQALGGPNPKIKLNRLQSESDWNVQKGMEQLLRGFYQAVRNPRSHEKVTDSEDDAQALLVFIGYLIRSIDQARSQFSRSDFLKRVLDRDFVPQERYAKLLVDQVPVGQRLEVFLDVYRAKEGTDPAHLFYFFSALLPELSEAERAQVYDAISDELKVTEDDETIRLNLASFDGEIWPHLDEAVRLRVEHRLVRSVREGRWNKHRQTVRSGGALGTWASRIIPHFTLKDEMVSAISSKLVSKDNEQVAYAFEFATSWLDDLSDSVPLVLGFTLVKGLKAGDRRFHGLLSYAQPWPRDIWPPALVKAYDEFAAVEVSTAAFDDDDIPF